MDLLKEIIEMTAYVRKSKVEAEDKEDAQARI